MLAILGFLVTRLLFIDRDLPPWPLAMYQPIDEFSYTLPAFNLHQHGTWTYQPETWAPVEGAPTNALQSLLTAATLNLDWSYVGLRGSAVILGLVTFLALLAVAARLVRDAQRDAISLPWPATALVVATGLLLLVDFSFLLSGRVVEPTAVRLAGLAVLLWLVGRGTFLGTGHTPLRSAAMGLAAGALATFGYVYSAFVIPGVLLAIIGWGSDRTSRRSLATHLVLALVGVAVAVGAYFAWVALVYGMSPIDWYDRYLAAFRTAGRATGIDLTALWDLVVGNLFRLDRPLFALTVVLLPVFAWWAIRRRDALGITVLAMLASFAAQCTVQSDYPQRKMLVLLAFTVPIVVGGLLRLGELRDRLDRSPRARLLALAWLGAVSAGTLVLALGPRFREWTALARFVHIPPASQTAFLDGLPGRLVAIGAVTGLAALVVLVVLWRRPAAARLAGLALLASMLVPLLAFDARFVFTRVTTQFRDAMQSVQALPDHAVISGEHAYAMQLYNDATPVLQGYWYLAGLTQPEYDALVVRWFSEGRSRWMFAYADEAGRERWETLGFEVVETYPIPLPKERVMGRYRYVGTP